MIDLESIESYLQQNLISFDSNVLKDIVDAKKIYIKNEDETNANYFWYLEKVYIIKELYVHAYHELVEAKYESAWNHLDQTDILIGDVCENFDLYVSDLFGLLKIRNQIHDLQKLFPYVFFLSRESVIIKERCSICGKENGLRNHCNHIPGKLYMGKMCAMIVEKMDLKAFALVRDPFDKYTMLKPEDKEYNYFMLEHLLINWKDPYDFFNVATHKEKKTEFHSIGRNELCPCGSDKKYKKCCLGTNNELYDHHEIIFSHPIKPIKKITGNTWK